MGIFTLYRATCCLAAAPFPALLALLVADPTTWARPAAGLAVKPLETLGSPNVPEHSLPEFPSLNLFDFGGR